MNFISNILNKITKHKEGEPEQNIPEIPVIQSVKPLTQEEKDERLLRAVIMGEEKKAVDLLMDGANPNYESRANGSVILRLACSVYSPRDGFNPKVVFDAAVKAGLDLNKMNKDGLTPLMQMAHDGLGDRVIEQFMQWGYGYIDEDMPAKNGEPASKYVKSHLYRMRYGDTRWRHMKDLVDNNKCDSSVAFELNEIDAKIKSWKMIHAVIRDDQVETLKMLNEGADPNCVAPVNGSLIEQLARVIDNPRSKLNPQVVFDVAVNHGLDINLYNRFLGHTPMTALISKGVSDIALNGIIQMADGRIDMEAIDAKGKTVGAYIQERETRMMTLAMAQKQKTYQ